MPRPIIFIDLAGTLVVRDPQSRRLVAWTGVAGLLFELAREHDLHLATGESPGGARAALADLGVESLFTDVHADLPMGGKPFGALAQGLGVPPRHCLMLGDDHLADTAGDTDAVVTLLLRHETRQVPVARVREVVARLRAEDGFLAGFEALLGANGSVREVDALDRLAGAALGDDCRLGWWRRTETTRRPVVVLSA
jgi:hypothetical protein